QMFLETAGVGGWVGKAVDRLCSRPWPLLIGWAWWGLRRVIDALNSSAKDREIPA
ncbi:hypothetical protein SK128_007795, partial [Halocaridina rubra]